jgi:hypothetical protein
VTVDLEPVANVPIETGDLLTLVVSTRVGTNADDTRCAGTGATHRSAQGLRVYYDSMSRPSRLVGTGTTSFSETLFLRSNGTSCPAGGGQSVGVTDRDLDESAPTAAAAKCLDSQAVAFPGGNPWKDVGAWGALP